MKNLLTFMIWMTVLAFLATGCGGGGTLFILEDPRGLPTDDIEDIQIAVLQCMRDAGDWKETNDDNVWNLQLRKGPLKTERKPGAQDLHTVGLTNFFTKTIELSTFNRIDMREQVETFWATSLGHEMIHVYLGAFDKRNTPHSHKCFRTFDNLARYHACNQIAKLRNAPNMCSWIQLEVPK
jgi:hypothetical protein